jgi:WD40 repeat protein/serine/threonine protein kinase
MTSDDQAPDPNHAINRQVDAICARFEAAWLSDASPQIEEFLEPLPGDTDNRLLLGLVKLDLLYRTKQGEAPEPNEYAKRFPEHAAEIRQLLNELTETLLPDPQARQQQKAYAKTTTETSSRRIGPYKLLQLIGEGGMGAVYMADQLEPVKRRVALKLIKSGMDSKQVVARFEAERQALAMMDHQNIAKVLDAGITDDGTPYFAMELVQGMPITKYCDRGKLSIPDRLKLFVQVCRALQHAHQKGVIHRDIKPSNVLVTQRDGVPVAKVIDFGLAKAMQSELRLTDKTLFTEVGQVCGTLEYMSPEQAEMNELGLDTRTDVYSLGVLLYELLTGSTPLGHDRVIRAAFHRVLELIITEEAPRPSRRLSESGDAITGISEQRRIEPRRLSGILKRELDWIALKALEKDRDRRYDGAGLLADDVQHYLDGDVVTARPPTTGYRIRKAIRKHKTAFVSGTVLVLLLLAGLIGTGSMWFRAQREAERAQTAEADRKLALHKVEIQRQAVVEEADKANAAEVKARAAEVTAMEEAIHARLAERNAYDSDIQVAQSDWEHANIDHLRGLIDKYQNRDDLKGFEWGYLDRLANSMILTLKGHVGHVNSVSFSPDGKRIVSGSGDHTVKLWNAETGREIRTLKGHTDDVESVSFSSDGNRIVSGSGDNTVKLWNAETGQELLTLKSHLNWIACVRFSPDGKRIVSGSNDNTVKVWDAETGQETLTLKGHAGTVFSVSFSPDGRQIASGSRDETVKLWDGATGEQITTLWGHSGSIYSVNFSPDGMHIVSGSGDRTVKLWDAATGEEVTTLKGHSGSIYSVNFSPDGTRIASGSSDKTVKLWEGAAGKEITTLMLCTDSVTSVSFSPDGKRIASGSGDQTISVQDTEPKRQTLTLKGHIEKIVSVRFSPDGRRIFSGSADQTLRVWDSETGQETHILKVPSDIVATCVNFSSDGKQIVTGNEPNHTIKLQEIETGQITLTLKGHSAGVTCVSFSLDGKRIVSGCDDATVKVWDATTGQELLTLRGHFRELRSVNFSPDGKRIVSGSLDNTVKVWDATTGQELLTLKGHFGFVTCAVVSPDGKWIVSGSRDMTVRVWDATTGQEKLTLNGHAGGVTSVLFSPDGKRIVSGCEKETVKLWDAETGQETLALKGHNGEVTSVSFSLDGKRIVSGSVDKTVKVWDARPWTAEQRFARRAIGP